MEKRKNNGLILEDSVILQTRHLDFSYVEGKKALSNVNVSIRKGERIAVLGENGAGKSTFFLNLNGVRVPENGEIILYGMPITKKNRQFLHKEVGIVFQDADHQIIASTVKAEIAFGPMNMHLSREEVEKCTKMAMEEMNLTSYADRPPHYLSGGEKKRVSIADILAMDSSIIIFDEPTSNLDPANAKMLEDVLSRLQQSGKTVLLSTHDVDFAYRFADRILVFSKGRLIADDVPDVIFLDQVLLKRANLKQPIFMQITNLLREHHFLIESHQNVYAKNIEELAGLLR